MSQRTPYHRPTPMTDQRKRILRAVAAANQQSANDVLQRVLQSDATTLGAVKAQLRECEYRGYVDRADGGTYSITPRGMAALEAAG